MAKQVDAQKHAEWRERLDRFDASGRTVAQFCREEGVTSHRFYYWVKRVRGSKGSRQARDRKQAALRADATSRDTLTTSKGGPFSEQPSSVEPRVHFTWDSKLRISVPADCLDAIRCVLQFASDQTDDPHVEVSTAQAFRQVIVADRK